MLAPTSDGGDGRVATLGPKSIDSSEGWQIWPLAETSGGLGDLGRQCGKKRRERKELEEERRADTQGLTSAPPHQRPRVAVALEVY